MNSQEAQNQITALGGDENAFARLDLLLSQAPDHIYDWLFSERAAKNVVALGKKFNLSETQTIQMSRLTGLVILKTIPLNDMPLELKKMLRLEDGLTRQLAIDIALAQLLPIRDYLPGTENFIKQLGGSLPAILPPLLKSSLAASYQTATALSGAAPSPAPAPKITIVQKTLRQIVQDNKEALNQILTASPLKIADFDQPVRGTIKNWLADYVRQKGAGKHEAMQRGDYLFQSANAKNLPSQEKLLLAEILKSYDENSTLIYDEAKKMIVPESPKERNPAVFKKPVPSASAINSPSAYREPIEKKDLSATPASPTKITSPIDNRVINLKDLQ
jgi:hypothetical protein